MANPVANQSTKANNSAQSMAISLIVENLTIGYNRHPAVHHLSFFLKSGEPLLVVGPNGAGKSSLLKTLVGLEKPLEGKINFFDETTLAKIKRPALAYLPQISEINRQFPIKLKDFVALGFIPNLGFFKTQNKFHKQRVLNMLADFSLEKLAHAPIEQLSGGQLRRAEFVRLMLMDAPLIMLDEPFNALDASMIKVLLKLLKTWEKAGKTIIIVAHDWQRLKAFFPKTLLLAREVITFGKTDKVLTEKNWQKAVQHLSQWSAAPMECER